MKLIVGLGNPGPKYIKTRHNLGKRVVLELAKDLNCPFKRSFSFKSFIARADTEAGLVILAAPFTFMNLSGRAVKLIQRRKKFKHGNLIIVCDDINLDFGTIRIRPGGSSGGHNGLRSVIEELETNELPRLRIGIKNRARIADLSKYVLSDFTRYEDVELDAIIRTSVECLKLWIGRGINSAMNKFNRK